MRTPKKFLTLSTIVFLVSGCAKKETKIPIFGQFGSMTYSGHVLREETEHAYNFRILDLTLKLNPGVTPNATDSIQNPRIRLVTTSKRSGDNKVVTTSEALSYPLNLMLDRSHLSGRVHDITLTSDKQKVLDSAHTTISLTDGHMLWPFDNELKP